MAKTVDGALSPYRILDLTDSKGAYCAKLLADMGADVIKVEPPEGDPLRFYPPFAGDEPHLEKSLYFLYRNTNKRGITLDLENREGKTFFKKLVISADVLVENFPPDYMESLGLGYPVLKEINPGLVMAGMTEFGRTGPYKNYKGSNLVHFALSGVMVTSGFPEKTPCMMPGSPAHDATSVLTAVSILAALYWRGITGRGQSIDMSVHESARVGLYPWVVSTYSHNLDPDGPPPVRETRLGASVYPVYPCKDGLIRVIALTPRQWKSLVRVLGNPEVLLLPEWEDFIYRIGNADALYALMLEFTSQYTMIELFEAGHREGVPIVPIFNIPGFVDSPQTRARKFFVELNHPVVGQSFYPGPPYKWTRTTPGVGSAAPCLGEHNEEVYREMEVNNNSAGVSAPSGHPEKKKESPKAPLDGVRVISLGTGAVIPDLGKVLGELGADVIKIESNENLDFMRTISWDKNASAGFNESNRSKRSFGVNLKTEKGLDIVRRLIRMSDIVGENFRGGVVKSLGVDYEAVSAFKPDIIYISSQGFGGGGPYSDFQAYGPMLSSASGLLSIWAHPEDPYPVGSNAPFPDHLASKIAVAAVLAALDYRRRTGLGQFIDLAQTEVAASLIGEYYLDYFINGRTPAPQGNRSAVSALNGCYPCKGDDNWCAISIFTEEEWKRFCNVIGEPAWTADPKFSDLDVRKKNIEELDSRIAEWTADRDSMEIMETLQGAGIAAGVLQRAPESMEDPQLKWLNAIIELDHPFVGKRLYPNVPFKLSESPPCPSTPAPILGQHTEEICRDLIEMTPQEIDSLKKEGVLEFSDT